MTDYGRFGDDYVTAWIDQIQALADAGDLYASICHANPLTGGNPAAYAAEVIGPDYVREPMEATREAYNLLSNANAMRWINLPPGTHISWLAAFDADVAGSLVAAAPLWQAVDLASGGSYPLEPGDFAIGLDVAVGP